MNKATLYRVNKLSPEAEVAPHNNPIVHNLHNLNFDSYDIFSNKVSETMD